MTNLAESITVEIVTIGDELTAGFTLDRNAQYIAQLLHAHGFRVRAITSVGDIPDDIEEAIRLAMRRSQVVITTGGLGPTDDDMTKRSLVKLFKRNLVFHEEIWAEIEARFKARGIDIPKINQNQALLPQGATFLPNKFGSAVGIALEEEGRVSISLPGVPREMQQILVDEVLPFMNRRFSGQPLSVRTLRTTGQSESSLAERINAAITMEPGVKLAYLPSYSGVALRVTATGDSQESADEKASRLVVQLEEVVGKYLFGYDDDSLEEVIGQLLRDNDKTLAVAESCTGGQLGMTITSVAGSSAWFLGGVLAYANEVKIEQLGVDETLLQPGGPGAVSEECAQQMAVGCRQKLRSDYALAITGIAGPDGGTDEKPVGTVFIGLASAHQTLAKKFSLGRDRSIVRERSVYAALELLRREILDLL